MPSTTIKVPVELRDRLASLASRESTTLAGAIARSLDAADTAAFWADVGRTMGASDAGSAASSDVEQLSGSLTAGLDPDETWEDVWAVAETSTSATSARRSVTSRDSAGPLSSSPTTGSIDMACP
jgi:hypothetical protein